MKTTHEKRAALYLRVSTDQQQTDAQRQECAAYALREHLPIITTETDTASGAKPWRDRKLSALVYYDPHYSDLIVYEYSRIGRDMLDTLDLLKVCNERGITVHVAKSNTVVRADIGGKVISTVMSLAAEIERDLLRSRTKDALAERQRKIDTEGGFTSAAGNYITHLGRPKGSGSISKIDQHKADIYKLFDAQVADAAIGRMFGCDRRTVKKMRDQYDREKKCKPTTA
jgi:DNA invertase Pin-like site-specific DNA recombinase